MIDPVSRRFGCIHIRNVKRSMAVTTIPRTRILQGMMQLSDKSYSYHTTLHSQFNSYLLILTIRFLHSPSSLSFPPMNSVDSLVFDSLRELELYVIGHSHELLDPFPKM